PRRCLPPPPPTPRGDDQQTEESGTELPHQHPPGRDLVGPYRIRSDLRPATIRFRLAQPVRLAGERREHLVHRHGGRRGAREPCARRPAMSCSPAARRGWRPPPCFRHLVGIDDWTHREITCRGRMAAVYPWRSGGTPATSRPRGNPARVVPVHHRSPATTAARKGGHPTGG